MKLNVKKKKIIRNLKTNVGEDLIKCKYETCQITFGKRKIILNVQDFKTRLQNYLWCFCSSLVATGLCRFSFPRYTDTGCKVCKHVLKHFWLLDCQADKQFPHCLVDNQAWQLPRLLLKPVGHKYLVIKR